MNHTTSLEVQNHLYHLLKGSEFAKAVSGTVYHDGTRPRDSKREDLVVKFTAGVPGDIDEGVATILIYSQPIQSRGVLMPNLKRIETLQRLAKEWLDSLTASDYIIQLKETIQTHLDPDLEQHFTSVKITYRKY